jgi:Ca2+-binding RTX toxin-like protein
VVRKFWGNDFLNGRGGVDRMNGGGNDQLLGGWGGDALDGGRGQDRLNGQSGDDFLWGGRDADEFVFTAETLRRGGVDRVMDFDGTGRDADTLIIDGVAANRTRLYQDSDSAVSMVRLDDGGASYVEVRNTQTFEIRDDIEFI